MTEYHNESSSECLCREQEGSVKNHEIPELLHNLNNWWSYSKEN